MSLRRMPRATVWRVELGGRRRCRLLLIPPGVPRAATTVSQGEISYAVSPKGVDFSGEWTLRFASRRVRFFELTVGEGLRLTQVDLDRQSCEWLPAPVEKGPRKVRVRIPETIREGDAVLRVKGIAPAVSSVPRTLPRVYTPMGRQLERRFKCESTRRWK